MINFCLVGDRNYLSNYAPTVIRSLNYYHPRCNVHLITMDRFVDEDFKSMGLPCNIIVHKVDSELLKVDRYKGTPLDHITMDSFLKIFIFKVLPKEKFIYLDVDTICCGYLGDLLDIDAPFIATEDMWAWKYKDNCHDPNQSIGMNWKHISLDPVRFSTGMFCVDLSDPNMDLFDKFVNKLSMDKSINCDALLFNKVIDTYYSIPQKYDFCVSYINGAIEDGYYSQAKSVMDYLRDNRDDLRLIHFPGPNKPWNTKVLMFKNFWDKFNE